MKIQSVLTTLVFASMTMGSSVMAQNPAAPKLPTDGLPKLRILTNDNRTRDVWFVEDTPGAYRVKETAQQTNSTDISKGQVATLFIYEPQEWREAFDLFNQEKYEEALAKFKEVQEKYSKTNKLPNNYSTRSMYYEMEIFRILGKIPEMLAIGEKIDKRELESDKTAMRQFELHPLYSAIQKKDWERSLKVAEQFLAKTNFSLGQRAQIYWLQGQAFQNLNKMEEALNAYGACMVADLGASHTIVKDAALRSLEIYSKDSDLLEMLAKIGQKDAPEKGSPQDIKLSEAGALAKVFSTIMFPDYQLPAEYAKFIQYAPKVETPEAGAEAAPKPADEGKTEDKKADEDKKPEEEKK